MPKSERPGGLDFGRAAQILETEWQNVTAAVSAQPGEDYVHDPALCQAIADS